MASNGLYLENTGKLVSSPNPNCYFLLGFHDEDISLCDDSGRFLSCIGGDGLLKVNKSKVTRDELFKIQDSEPQFTMRNLSRGAKGQVSARNGSEVKADQADVQDSERFQFEVSNGVVHIRTNKLFYWAPREDGSIGAVADKQSAATAFVIDYSAGNTVRIQHQASGRNVYAKPHGGLFANDAGHDDEAELFELTIINRPTLVLRGQYGFLGLKGASGRVECNRSTGDIFKLEAKGGEYYISTQNGNYWTVDRDGVAALSSTPVAFFFEFTQHSKALIKHKESGKYLQGEQSGGFTASATGEHTNSLWEY
jgi:fascin 1/2